MDYQKLANLLKVVAEPNRLKILGSTPNGVG